MKNLSTYTEYTSLNESYEVSKNDLKRLEEYADSLFKEIGIDVEFTRHFLDRVNDRRNKKQISYSELQELFRETRKEHGKEIPRLGERGEAVIKDMRSDINMPFVLEYDPRNKELDLVAKTVMRKKNFMTSNKVLKINKF